jgi:hypothetical protein
MKCGYYEQEKHEFILCAECEGRGHKDSSNEKIASGFMNKTELKRRVNEDFFAIQGRDPNDIFKVSDDQLVDPEDLSWDQNEEEDKD